MFWPAHCSIENLQVAVFCMQYLRTFGEASFIINISQVVADGPDRPEEGTESRGSSEGWGELGALGGKDRAVGAIRLDSLVYSFL